MNTIILLELLLLSGVSLQLISTTSHTPECSLKVDSCEPIKYNVCLGAKVGFTHTSLAFLNGSLSTQHEIQEELKLWTGLQNFHKCWSVVQQLLCSVYMPKCDPETNRTQYPSREWCRRAQNRCKIVKTYNNNTGWPDFLQCNQRHFKENCKDQAYLKVTFNTTGKCEWPLVNTNNSASWYGDMEGCGLQCKNPLFTNAEHKQVHIFIGFIGTICLLSSFFTILTFLIDWKNASRYPALILFFINACFFMGCIGWLAQFAGSAREDIVCKADKTVRIGEPQPGSGESASCTIVFLLIYYFMMAGVVWFVMLAYAWHITFKALGTPRDILTGKTAYFHIIAWCVPLVLSIICLASSEIDGDYMSGICFVGYVNHGVRAGFVLVPVILVLIFGLYFMLRALSALINVEKETPDFISNKATAKIHENIVRIGLFASLSILFVLITFCVHVYTFVAEDAWRSSLKSYILCKVEMTVTNQTASLCDGTLSNRPSIVATLIHIFAFFGAGILMSSWSWNRASLSAWERFLRKVFQRPSNRPVKLKRHKMIARAFARRKEMNSGRFSVSFYSTHDDPLEKQTSMTPESELTAPNVFSGKNDSEYEVKRKCKGGMKFDLNSMSSADVSSEFAANMPKLVRRRGGMFQPMAGTLRRYSDSDIASVTSRIFSMENSDEENPQQEDPKQKKKKKRGKPNRVKPQLTPFVLAMQRGAQELLKSKRQHHTHHKRRGSDSSVLSHASAQSVRFSLDRNSSVDDMSLTSMRPSSRNYIKPKAEPKNKRITNFAIFTASSFLPGSVGDSESQDVHLAMGELSKDSGPCMQCGGQGTEIAIFNIEDDESSSTSSSSLI